MFQRQPNVSAQSCYCTSNPGIPHASLYALFLWLILQNSQSHLKVSETKGLILSHPERAAWERGVEGVIWGPTRALQEWPGVQRRLLRLPVGIMFFPVWQSGCVNHICSWICLLCSTVSDVCSAWLDRGRSCLGSGYLQSFRRECLFLDAANPVRFLKETYIVQFNAITTMDRLF